MKAISSVISTILMLLVTISIAGMVYLYITGIFTSRTATSFSISYSYGNDIIISNDGTNPIIEFTRVTVDDLPVEYTVIPQDDSLVGYWKFDEGSGNKTYDSTINNNNGNFSGTIIGDFENTLDGFSLGCGGLPTSSYIPGKIGNGLKLWSTGGDGLACASKSLGSAKSVGYMIWFYGKGYVKAGVWNGSQMISYVEDANTGCKTPNGDTSMWFYCNSNQPYSDWKLFKLVVYVNSISVPEIFVYNNPIIGETYAGYYDFMTDGPVWAAGKFGKALSFDGENDYIQVADNASLRLTTYLSVTAWIKTLLVRGVIASKLQDGGNNRGFLFAVDQNILKFSRSVDGTWAGYQANSPGAVNDGLYHFVGVTYGDGYAKLYVDGNLVTSPAASGNIYESTAPVQIGAYYQEPTYKFEGIIDEVRIYNRTLTDQEIKAAYNIGSMIKPGTTATMKISGQFSKGTHTVRACTSSVCRIGYFTLV